MSKLDGRYSVGEYTLVFNVNTLCDLEEAMGVEDVNELLQVFNELGTNPSMRKIRQLFHAALRQEHPDVTPQDAGQIVSDLGLDAATEALTEALTLAFPDAEESGESAEGKSRKPRGAGKAS